MAVTVPSPLAVPLPALVPVAGVRLGAAEAGIRIDHGDLTALLYLQGFTDEDIVR